MARFEVKDPGNGSFLGNVFMGASQLVTYADQAEYPITDKGHWQVDWSHFSPDGDPFHPWHYDFYGKNLRYDAGGMLTGGKIDSMEVHEGRPYIFNNPNGDETLRLQITDLNLPVEKLLAYAKAGDDIGFQESVFHGDDAFVGSAMAEVFNGYAGDDTYTGGGGPDHFLFEGKWGKDRITDFQASGANHDVIVFAKGLFSGFDDVMAHTKDVNGTALIELKGYGSITLDHVTKADLHADDFQFHTAAQFRAEDYQQLESYLMQLQHPHDFGGLSVI